MLESRYDHETRSLRPWRRTMFQPVIVRPPISRWRLPRVLPVSPPRPRGTPRMTSAPGFALHNPNWTRV